MWRSMATIRLRRKLALTVLLVFVLLIFQGMSQDDEDDIDFDEPLDLSELTLEDEDEPVLNQPPAAAAPPPTPQPVAEPVVAPASEELDLGSEVGEGSKGAEVGVDDPLDLSAEGDDESSEGEEETFVLESPSEPAASGGAGESGSAEDSQEDNFDVELHIVHPRMGQVLPDGPSFAVRIEINVADSDQDRFKEVYEHTFLCLSLDYHPSACYPMFHEIPIRFKAEKGVHTIHAHVTDPKTGDMVEDSRSDAITFRLGPQEVPQLSGPFPGTEVAKPEEPEPDDEAEQVQIGIPSLSVEYPAETDSIPDDRFDVIASVEAPDPEAFQTHFKAGLIAVSLDGDHYACFPVVDAKFYPRFMNVDGGVHFLVAQLVHPQSFELIPETSSGPRTFQSRPRPVARKPHSVDLVIDQRRLTFKGETHKSRATDAMNFCHSRNVFEIDCVVNIMRSLIQKIARSRL